MPQLGKLTAAQFQLDAEALAQLLIGAILIRRGDLVWRARIVETEAYLGPADLASHSSKGLTPRTKVMFGPPGRAYVYLIYGMYNMLNVVCGGEGNAHAVLIRAAEPLDHWAADLSGPGKLARAFEITRLHNGINLRSKELSIWHDPLHHPAILRTARIGVDYARHWKDALLRFHDADSAAVSGRKRNRRRVISHR